MIVNRVWQHHFGQGLVRTVNDFGARCDPELQVRVGPGGCRPRDGVTLTAVGRGVAEEEHEGVAKDDAGAEVGASQPVP